MMPSFTLYCCRYFENKFKFEVGDFLLVCEPPLSDTPGRASVAVRTDEGGVIHTMISDLPEDGSLTPAKGDRLVITRIEMMEGRFKRFYYEIKPQRPAAPAAEPTYYEEARVVSQPQQQKKEKNSMRIFDAVVVQTKQMPAGEGLTTSVTVSKVVYSQIGFSAPNEATAKAIVVANAIKADHTLVIDDPTAPVEVVLRSW